MSINPGGGGGGKYGMAFGLKFIRLEFGTVNDDDDCDEVEADGGGDVSKFSIEKFDFLFVCFVICCSDSFLLDKDDDEEDSDEIDDEDEDRFSNL